MKHAEKELASQKKAFAAKEKEGAKLTKELAAAEAAAEKAKTALAEHPGADAEKVAELESRKERAEAGRHRPRSHTHARTHARAREFALDLRRLNCGEMRVSN